MTKVPGATRSGLNRPFVPSMPNPTGGTYWIAKAGGEPVAGINPIDSPHFASVPEAWLGYIAVDDVDGRVKKATAAGGKVMREPFDIPGVGRIAILMDSRGAAIGLMTPAG
jgi:predicted enzyme related to lactoylglutathione lyase